MRTSPFCGHNQTADQLQGLDMNLSRARWVNCALYSSMWKNRILSTQKNGSSIEIVLNDTSILGRVIKSYLTSPNISVGVSTSDHRKRKTREKYWGIYAQHTLDLCYTLNVRHGTFFRRVENICFFFLLLALFRSLLLFSYLWCNIGHCRVTENCRKRLIELFCVYTCHFT